MPDTEERWGAVRVGERRQIVAYAKIVDEIDVDTLLIEIWTRSGQCVVRNARWPRAKVEIGHGPPPWAARSQPGEDAPRSITNLAAVRERRRG
jgi:hypothetical protein